uniref:Uncharacterized protein n=1 Tax=Cacopsylla melanoneura TaxID=428564 RepID=A0A8D9A5U9_9HEMI
MIPTTLLSSKPTPPFVLPLVHPSQLLLLFPLTLHVKLHLRFFSLLFIHLLNCPVQFIQCRIFHLQFCPHIDSLMLPIFRPQDVHTIFAIVFPLFDENQVNDAIPAFHGVRSSGTVASAVRRPS